MTDEREVEGVRILGAQEAKEVVRTQPSAVSRKSGTTTKTTRESVVTAPTEQTTNVELPHWSEAPTGEVPQAVLDSDGNADGWEALTGSQPRIRVDQNDWKEADYDPSLNLKDDSLSVGALGDDHISLEDNDEEFERTVAQKRTPRHLSKERGGSKENQTESGQKITKISTVPDSASAEPIPGSSHMATSETSGRSKVLSSNLKREKREGPSDHQATDQQSEHSHSEINTLIKRTLTASALAIVAIICFILGAIPTLLFSACVITAMSFELSNAFKKIGAKPATLLIGVMTFFSVIAGYLIGDRAIAVSSVTFFVFGALWYLFSIQKGRPVIGLGISSLVYLYVGILGSFAGMILSLHNSQGKSVGIPVFIAAVVCVGVNDTAAYFVGRFLGRTPLAPSISPNKTFEGTTAGIILSLFAGVFLALSSESIFGGINGGIMFGILIACAAIFGDLIESMLKRDCKLKDFGTLLPGHGGLMDRFDGLLFALPVAYYIALVLL